MMRLPDKLYRTSQGDGFFGEALREAFQLEWLGPSDRAVLMRWSTGFQTATDGFRLQDIALRIRNASAPH